MRPNRNPGFTLIELSIVLVIIALIVGAILTGQDLIKAAEIRATVAQVEKYNSAVNTFRGKFNALPGDIPETSAANFGLFALSNSNITGQGDGNGLIEGGSSGSVLPEGETLAFWRHLSDANLVDGAFGSVSNAALVTSTGLVTGTVTLASQSVPPAKINLTNYFIVYANNGVNYFQLMPVLTITSAPVYTFGTTGITPLQANNIDIKLDDGLPNTGIIIARDTGQTYGVDGQASWAATSTNNYCMTNGASASDPTDTYNVNIQSGGNSPSCSVRFRFN